MSTCTPLWVTLLLAAVTLFGTHRLTLRREHNKSTAERRTKWLERFRADLKSIVAAATKHFCDPMKLNSELSAAEIMGDLRRMRVTIHEAKFQKSADATYLMDGLITLNDKITGLAEFQNPSRAALPANHEAIHEIMEAERYMLEVASRPQK